MLSHSNKDDDAYDAYDEDFWPFMKFYHIMLMN